VLVTRGRISELADLSTNPNGQHVSTRQFTAAFHAVRGHVRGYWLNIPAAGKACPKCGPPKPAVALPLLRSILG
jgi:hypothetical protein